VRSKLFILPAWCSLALAVPSTAGEQLAWLRTASPDGAFSVETPCSAEEVDRGRALPVDIVGRGINLPVSRRVICPSRNIVLVAGVVEEPRLPKNGPSLFDGLLMAGKDNPKGNKGTPTITTISGHRAWLNRAQEGGEVAQVGYVEIGHARMIFAHCCGAPSRAGVSKDEQVAMIDHFFGSIQVDKK